MNLPERYSLNPIGEHYALENMMAKGQRRGNREIRKPKQIRKPEKETASAILSKGITSITGKS